VNIVYVTDKQNHPYFAIWRMSLTIPIKKSPWNGGIDGRRDYNTRFNFPELCLKLFFPNDQNFHRDLCGNKLIYKNDIVSFPPNV
jgi:hypothetical protein